MNATRRAMLWVIVSTLLWAVVEEIATRVQRPYTVPQIVWTRYSIHLLFTALLWGWREPALLLRTRRLGFQLARSSLMLVTPMAYALSITHGVPPSPLFGVFWVAPLLIVLLAIPLLGERPSWSTWAVVLVGYIGAWLAQGSPPFPFNRLGFPLLMALSFSLYVVMTRALRTESIRANLFYTAFGVWALLTPFVGRNWLTPTPHDMLVYCAVAILGWGSLYAIDRLAHEAPVSLSAPFTYAQVVFTVALWTLHPQIFIGRRIIAGLLLIIATAAFAWIINGTPRRQTVSGSLHPQEVP